MQSFALRIGKDGEILTTNRPCHCKQFTITPLVVPLFKLVGY